MSGFCGSDVCAARMQMFLLTGPDSGLVAPCPQCRDALTDSLVSARYVEEDWARVMRSVHNVISGRL